MDGTNPTNGGSNIDSKHGWSDSQSMVLDAEHHQDNRFAIRIDQIVHPIAVLSSGIVTKDDVHARQDAQTSQPVRKHVQQKAVRKRVLDVAVHDIEAPLSALLGQRSDQSPFPSSALASSLPLSEAAALPWRRTWFQHGEVVGMQQTTNEWVVLAEGLFFYFPLGDSGALVNLMVTMAHFTIFDWLSIAALLKRLKIN